MRGKGRAILSSFEADGVNLIIVWGSWKSYCPKGENRELAGLQFEKYFNELAFDHLSKWKGRIEKKIDPCCVPWGVFTRAKE